VDVQNLGVRYDVVKGLQFDQSQNPNYVLAQQFGAAGRFANVIGYEDFGKDPKDDMNNVQPRLGAVWDVRGNAKDLLRRTDARHRISASATLQLAGGFRVSPIFLYRSALPVYLGEGVDLNNDGELNDLPQQALAFDGFDAAGVAKTKAIGACETINCGRGAAFSQLNLRASKAFRLAGRANLEVIGEIFNLFNAINPANFERVVSNVTQTVRLVGGTANPNYMQPSRFAGDFQQPEQRVGQIGFRFTF
jgi:hypothetical protein